MLQLCICQDIDAWKFGEHSKKARVASPRATAYASFVLSKLPSAQYLDIRIMTDELIVNYLSMIFTLYFSYSNFNALFH